MLPPFYYKPVDDDGLFAAYAEIIERVGNSSLKILLYHIPQNTGVPITLDLIDRLPARIRAPLSASRIRRAISGT